ncbi:hypothetical protein [Prochlorococcus marinus]|uniref:hypothetical protein n=1 Tax=Prochlorococcus marinus TaxID=1219 RepID=UPI0022B3E5CD|nr:hypothetical protein [Prochlorococcus marinus]
MYEQSEDYSNSPLTLEELKRIDNTSLSSRDKHFLRILGHCLACFKEMNTDLENGALPSELERCEWLLASTSYKPDDPFVALLLEQFASAATQLEELAERYQISPLELTIDHLINFLH